MTFTLLARDRDSGDLGIAVASRYPAVGGVVPYFRAGVGLVASQSYANPALAETVLDLLADGAPPPVAVAGALEGRDPAIRQLLVMTVAGETAIYSGERCTPEVSEAVGTDCIAAGNMLADAQVGDAMVAAFVDLSDLTLAERLIHALRAGEAAGGDMRGREAAAVRIWSHGYPDAKSLPLDLRADHDDDPIALLGRLLARRQAVEA